MGLTACSFHAPIASSPGAGFGAHPDISQSGGGGAWIAVHDAIGGSTQQDMVAGPDQAMWFVDTNLSQIGRIDMTKKIKEFPTKSPGAAPLAITVGPDGALWFTESNAKALGRMTTAGVASEFSTVIGGVNYFPSSGITVGPDNNLWFTAFPQAVIRATTAGQMTVFNLNNGCNPKRIKVGPDHNFWMSEDCPDVERLKTNGTLNQYPTPDGGYAWDITTGSDGNLYASSTGGYDVYQIKTAGTVTALKSPTYNWGTRGVLAVGSEIWFVGEGSSGLNLIAKLKLPGLTFPTPTKPGPPTLYDTRTEYFAMGPDGNVWFTNDNSYIGVDVLMALKLVPQTATIAPSTTVTITVTEKGYTGPWTASSSNTGVATVAPGSPGQFVVTGVAAGTATITIKDNTLNSAPAKITVS